MRRAARQCYHHHHHSFLLDASVSSSEAVFALRRPCPRPPSHRHHHHQLLRRFYGKHVVLKEYVTKEEDERRVLLNKHVVVTSDRLEHENISDPNKVLVKVRAFSVNPLDVEVSRGYLDKFLSPLLSSSSSKSKGIRLGKDFSGEIVKLGGKHDNDNSSDGSGERRRRGKFEIGDEVFGAISAADFKNGTMAEYVLVDRRQLMKKPKRLTHKEACAIPFAAYTAYACLRTTGCVDRKDPKRILVFGGGSAVGECVARIALRSGFATTVVATAGKASEQMLKEDVGVERVIGYENKEKKDSNIIISSSSGTSNSDSSDSSSSSKSNNEAGQNFTAKNSRFVDEAEPSFDVAIDTVGTSKTKFQATKALKKGTGTYITLHGDMAQLIGESGVLRGAAQASVELLREKTFARLQYDMGYEWGYANTNDRDATNLIEYLVDKGLLSVKVYAGDEEGGESFVGLESVERAFKALGDASKKGKIVVELPP